MTCILCTHYLCTTETTEWRRRLLEGPSGLGESEGPKKRPNGKPPRRSGWCSIDAWPAKPPVLVAATWTSDPCSAIAAVQGELDQSGFMVLVPETAAVAFLK